MRIAPAVASPRCARLRGERRGRERLGLALEQRACGGVVGGISMQNLERDQAVERRITGEEDLPHPAVAKWPHDLIPPEHVHGG